MKNINYQSMGAKIKLKRRGLGYTQEQLAEMCDISTGFLGHIENGTRTPSLETLYGIACALNSGIDYFLFDSADSSDNLLTQIGSAVRSNNPEAYSRFCNTVKVLADHMDEI